MEKCQQIGKHHIMASEDSTTVTGSSSLPAKTSVKNEEISRRYLGIVFALLAAFQYSISALLIKLLNYHPFNLGVWRFSVMILITVPFLLYGQFFQKPKNQLENQGSNPAASPVESVGKTESENINPKGILSQIWPINITTGFLILQAVLGSNSILFVFYGLSYLQIGDSIVISTSAPVFVTFVAWVFLKEPFGIVPVITAFLALFGVAIICKPPILTGSIEMNLSTLKGVGYSFTSMILLTFCYVIIRFLRKVNHALIQFTFAVWGLTQATILAFSFQVFSVPHTTNEIVLITVSALLAFSAQTCVTFALKYEQAGVVALVRTTEVLFCYLWQFCFLHAKPDEYSVIGAVITLGCVVLATLRKTVMSLSENNINRKRFGFLLF